MDNDSIKLPGLSPRLRMVAEMVPSCDRVIDIGTDHAFVPIDLVIRERCQSAVASDIHKGPAETARKNIAAYHLEDRIRVLVGDGLESVRPTMGDCVVIAGMGGFEIRSILMKGTPVTAKALILQPQRSFKELRIFLSQTGYAIQKEEIAREQDRYYVAMMATYTGIPYELTAAQLEIGPRILLQKPPLFEEYLKQRMIQLKKQRLGDPSIQAVMEQLETVVHAGC